MIDPFVSQTINNIPQPVSVGFGSHPSAASALYVSTPFGGPVGGLYAFNAATWAGIAPDRRTPPVQTWSLVVRGAEVAVGTLNAAGASVVGIDFGRSGM